MRIIEKAEAKAKLEEREPSKEPVAVPPEGGR